MKKLAVLLTTILLIVSCKQQFENTQETGEYGNIVIKFAPMYTVKTIGQNGLPNIADSEMKLIIEQEGSPKIEKNYERTDEKKFEKKFPIGSKLKFRVIIIGVSGQWKGDATHTVQKGENTVSIKLSKSATSLSALKFEIKKDTQHQGELSFELGLFGRPPFFKENISRDYQIRGATFSDYKVPSFCRDRLGRTYVYYAQDAGVASNSKDYHLKRFTSEGEVDNTFPVDSLSNESFTYFHVMADHVTGNVFKVFSKDTNKKDIKIEVITEAIGRIPTPVTLSLEKELVTLAVQNNVFAIVMSSSASSPVAAGMPVLKLYKYENGTFTSLQDNVIEMKDLLQTTLEGISSNEIGRIVDLAMKNNSIYLLYTLKNNEKTSTFGGVLKYSYTEESGIEKKGERIIGKAEYKRKGNAVNVQDEEKEFYGACKFVGFGENELYVADDGIVCEYDAGVIYSSAHKNRLVALNTKTEKLEIRQADVTTWLPEEKLMQTTKTPILFFNSKEESGNQTKSLAIYIEDENGSIAPTASFTKASIIRPDRMEYAFDMRGNFYLKYATDSSGVNTSIEKYNYSANGQYTRDYIFTSNAPDGSNWDGILYDTKQRELYLINASGNLYRYEGSNNIKSIDTSAVQSLNVRESLIYDGRILSYFKITGDSPLSLVSYEIKDNKVDPANTIDYSQAIKKIKWEEVSSTTNFLAYDDHLFVTYYKQEDNFIKRHYVGTVDMKNKATDLMLIYDRDLGEVNCAWIGYNKTRKELKLYIDDVEKDYDGRVISNLNKYTSITLKGDKISKNISDVPSGIIWNKDVNVWQGMKDIMLFTRTYAGTDPYKKIDPVLSDEASYYAVEENKLNESLPPTPSIETGGGPSGDTLHQFCYDQLGNLYVLHYMNGSYEIFRFKLGDDGKYNFTTPAVSYPLANPSDPFEKEYFRMAVAYVGKDTNDKDRFVLYHTGKSVNISATPATPEIKINAVEFRGDAFNQGTEKAGWQLTVPLKDSSSIGNNWYVNRDVMALSANKDGLFIAIREREKQSFTYTNSGGSAVHSDVDRAYNIQVRKYDLTGDNYKNNVKGVVNVVGTPEQRVSTEAYSNFSLFGSQGLKVDYITPNKYIQELVKDMFAYNGELYILTNSKIGGDVKVTSNVSIHSDKALTTMYSTGAIWKASSTNEFTGQATLIKKADEGDENRGTFAPLHFVAIMPKRLAIASDGFFVDDVRPLPTNPNDKQRRGKNSDKVLFLNLQDSNTEEKETKARFDFKVMEGEFGALYCGWGWND